MPMKKLQHIRVTSFREPLRTYERDTKGIEEQSMRSNLNYSGILVTPSVAEIDEYPTSQITLSKRCDNVAFSLLQRNNFTF